jgi:hypothetical protein
MGIPGINLPEYPALDQAIDDFRKALTQGVRPSIVESGGRLLEVAAGMAAAQSELHHSRLDVSLVDDLWVPLDRLTHEGLALLWLLRWAGSSMCGAPDPAAWEKSGEYFREALADRYPVSLLKAEVFRGFLETHPPAALGFEAPLIAAPPNRAEEGGLWHYRPCADRGCGVAVFGLPGSALEDGVVSWRPPHPGTFRAVVVSETKGGWAWLAFDLTVGAAPEPVVTPVLVSAGDDDGGWCFVATAAYGSRAEGKIRVLRDFRDRYLAPCPAGRALIRAYCTYGPAAADFIRERPALRAWIRTLLLPAIGFASLFPAD